MSKYIKGDAIANATSYELHEKVGSDYNLLTTKTEINFNLDELTFESGDHVLVVKATAEGYEASDYSNEVTYTVEEINNTVDITSQFNFIESRMINATNGAISTWDGWVATEDYVDVSQYSSIEIKMSVTSSTTTSTGLALYDENKTFVSGIPHTDGTAHYSTMIKTIEIPSNVKYVRTTYWSTSSANYKTEFGEFYCKGIL